jgi:hypothetical protein
LTPEISLRELLSILSARGQPLEIESLEASKVIQKRDVEASIEGLFSHV